MKKSAGRQTSAKVTSQPEAPSLAQCIPANYAEWFPPMVERLREAARLAKIVGEMISSQQFKLTKLHEKGLMLPDWDDVHALIWIARGDAESTSLYCERLLNRLFIAAFDANKNEAETAEVRHGTT